MTDLNIEGNMDYDPSYIRGHKDGIKVGREEASKPLYEEIKRLSEEREHYRQRMIATEINLGKMALLVEDRDLQKSALETDLMRLMTAIGPYSTVDSAAKFATKTRQQWADLVDAARAMVKHQRDRHELSSCCHDVTPTPTYLLEKALGDMAEKLKTERPTVFCNNCGFADLIVVDGVNYRHNDPKTGRPCNYHAVPVVPDKRISGKGTLCDKQYSATEDTYGFCGHEQGHDGPCGRGR